ncbi:MAG: VRR-NUC domain-containing protein [Cyclobacteriaceae bacterium]
MSEKEKIILPPRYYLDYFNYLIEFIEKHSGHLLGEGDRQFINEYRSLHSDAQCLFIRMLNRKGEFFRLDKLQYPEIEVYADSLDQLTQLEFITLDDISYPDVFKLFTKSELHQAFPEMGIKTMYKEEALETLTEEADENHYQTLAENWQIIRLLKQEQVNYLKFLFFGHNYGMMTEFVIRDVGNIKLENLDRHEFTPWFDTREEALATYELANLSRAFRLAKEELLPEEILELISPIEWENYLRFPRAKKAADKLLLRTGEYFEKAGLPNEALNFYKISERHPARERCIRILEKDGKIDEARSIAEAASTSPLNASELLFVNDFLAKKSVRNYRTTTKRIKESPAIEVIPDPTIKVEQLACEYFARDGYDAIHSENYLWRGLFGLVFWDVIFDENQDSFHHPLQRQPSDLFDEHFYTRRLNNLLAIQKKYGSKQKLKSAIKKRYLEKEGIANPLVSWHESLLPSLEEAVQRLPVTGLYNILFEMAKNVKYNSAGFPDLFIWKGKEYHFYEIKSPNDHLSAQQLFWIDFMQRNKIKAEILRLNYL